MKFKMFGRVFEIRGAVSKWPGLSDDKGFREYLAGKGYIVNTNTALQVAVVLRCVDVVAKTMASLPLHLMKRVNGSREKATDHVLYRLLSKCPNPETTAYDFIHMYIANLMMTRGAYAKIERYAGSGKIKYLWNIPTANVVDGRNTENGERFIKVYLAEGKTETLREGDYLYTPGFRLSNTDTPNNPISIASNVLGLTMALDGFAKTFFENGTTLSGVIEQPTALSENAYKRFQKSWQETYSGVHNASKVAILESGMKFVQHEKKLDDSQALESRQFQVIEICRIFGVPPHKVFDLQHATFSNIENLNIQYVQESITPMSTRLEQSFYKDLLFEKEQMVYYFKFNVNALLRGDSASRGAYYNTMRQNGIYSANEIRAFEDMNKISAEEGGDAYLVNGNMISMKHAEANLPKGLQK
jgi:HK97 family phage portal protein